MGLYDESDKNDFFENSEVTEQPKEPKKPKLTPDNPDYWEQPEDEFDHLRPSPRVRVRFWFWVAVSAVIIGVIWACYIRYFKAYISDATQYGYVEQIYRHGNMIHTYEGVILPYKNLMDTTRVYDGDFVFSTSKADIAARLKEMQFANKPVRVSYDVYHSTLPWRGKSKIVVTAVDSVNPRDILPPK